MFMYDHGVGRYGMYFWRIGRTVQKRQQLNIYRSNRTNVQPIIGASSQIYVREPRYLLFTSTQVKMVHSGTDALSRRPGNEYAWLKASVFVEEDQFAHLHLVQTGLQISNLKRNLFWEFRASHRADSY